MDYKEAASLLRAYNHRLITEPERLHPTATQEERLSLLAALTLAIEAIERYEKDAGENSKSYTPWQPDEEKRLIASFDDGRSVSEIAQLHKRTEGAITARLVRLGKIENPDKSFASQEEASIAGRAKIAIGFDWEIVDDGNSSWGIGDIEREGRVEHGEPIFQVCWDSETLPSSQYYDPWHMLESNTNSDSFETEFRSWNYVYEARSDLELFLSFIAMRDLGNVRRMLSSGFDVSKIYDNQQVLYLNPESEYIEPDNLEHRVAWERSCDSLLHQVINASWKWNSFSSGIEELLRLFRTSGVSLHAKCSHGFDALSCYKNWTTKNPRRVDSESRQPVSDDDYFVYPDNEQYSVPSSEPDERIARLLT